MSRVVLVTTEPVPLAGWPATGAGLRAWGLGHGLRSRGHEVTLLIPEDATLGFVPPEVKGARALPPTRELPDWIALYRRETLRDDARLRDCDVVVLQHWGIAREIGELTVPLAIDLAGPHLLERKLWGSASPEADLAEKLDALRRADFVTASGEKQRAYFLAYLAMAGWDVAPANDTDIVMPVIPFSLKADPNPAPVRADRFIYGGFFLPWQDPSAALEVLLEEMDRADRGELVFIGGAHPQLDVSRGKFDALARRLASHPRVRSHPPMSYDDYAALLRDGGIALDLMARNAERELAYTTRTVQYMACGLPVIHDNYSELGDLIERRGAGWSLDPADGEGLRKLIRGLLTGEIDPAPQARAAHALVRDKLDWDKTIDPLDAFCRAPRERPGKTATQLAAESRDRRLAQAESELETARAELNTLRGKRWVRWGLNLFSMRGLAKWPMAAFGFLMGLVLIPVFLLADLMNARR